ncbi:AAA family ATPase [Providencia rettgeri]|nr:AAA family ATPase [Providencia rettgeri]
MSVITINRSEKLEIISLLISLQKTIFENRSVIDLLDITLNLRLLPSKDDRYKDAYADLNQHFKNNNDWSLEYIFNERFDFLDSDELFTSLMVNLISPPKNNNSKKDIDFIYEKFNPILIRFGYEYKLKNYNELGLPQYIIVEYDEYKALNDISDNEIEFKIYTSGFLSDDKEFFTLTKSSWDDYHYKTTFMLKYHVDGIDYKIGEVKIISEDDVSTTEKINESFFKLSSEYASLGQSIDYYRNLFGRLDNDIALSVLKALNDVAFFKQIYESFDMLDSFRSSLTRFDDAERLSRHAKQMIAKRDLSNLYSFKYIFIPKYANKDSSLEINFKFDNNRNSIFPSRVYALIGKNGAGKTQIISKLPQDIADESEKLFPNNIPLFSKILAVSFSVFDKFEIPNSNSKLNYVYCGLRTKDRNIEKNLSRHDLEMRFWNSLDRIVYKKRLDSWVEINKEFFSPELVESWIIDYDNEKKVNPIKINESLMNLSSGQSIFLFIMTEIICHIQYDSLILFDEPETHLHPNAISQLINSIHSLAENFESYCIIATHSPIIVQGFLAKNVYIIKNEEQILSISHPSVETFGENLTKITDDIFGARDTPKYFQKEIFNRINEGYSVDDIYKSIQSKNTPLSLNVEILLESIRSK